MCNIAQKSLVLTQIIEHPALNAVRMGVVQALVDHGFKPGQGLEFTYENAQGNIVTAAQIAQIFVGKEPDVIVAISTPSAQTVVTAARAEIPIVFAAVTDPVAAKLLKTLDSPNNMVTGVLDRAPFEQQLLLIKQLLGNKNHLGFIYNASEINSIVALDIFKNQAEELGLKIIAASASNSAEVGIITQGIIDKVDAIYIPNDNTVVSSIDSIIKVCNDVKKPVFAADIMLVKRGVMAAIGVDYFHIGYLTGEIATKILQDIPVNKIPVITPQNNLLYINETQGKKIGFDIPASIVEKANKTF